MPTVDVNGVSLYFESQGNESDPVILMIMGLSVQLILWPQLLVDLLVAKGFRVVRFDNRDVGLSTKLDHLGVPNIPLEFARFMMHLPVRAPYRIDDMARDTAGLIDALGLNRPHVVGASMGGMIGQNLAGVFPDKVATLTSIMSTTGRRNLPKAQWRALQALMAPQPKRGDTEGAIRRLMRVIRLIGSQSYPADEASLRELCERHVLRSYHPAGGMRQLTAIAASDDRRAVVRNIKAPTLVIHGDEDPLVRPAAGADTAQTIRDGGGDARLAIFKGMGHDFPAQLIPQIAEEIAVHCRSHQP